MRAKTASFGYLTLHHLIVLSLTRKDASHQVPHHSARVQRNKTLLLSRSSRSEKRRAPEKSIERSPGRERTSAQEKNERRTSSLCFIPRSLFFLLSLSLSLSLSFSLPSLSHSLTLSRCFSSPSLPPTPPSLSKLCAVFY